MMQVDGRPNIRACIEPIREGIKVKHQNAWPSLNHDFFSIIEKIDRFLPVGFYYKTFINFPVEWHRVEGMIRKITGLGSVKEEIASWEEREKKLKDGEDEAFEHQYLQTDIAIVGGGPAGIVAALEASSLGAKVTLIDDQPSLGGHLRYSDDLLEIDAATGEEVYSESRGYDVADKLMKSVSLHKGLEVLTGATVFGFYESNLLGIVQGGKMIKLRAKEVIIASGAHEYLTVFQKNDLPGIFLSRGLQRLIKLYGVKPGESVVIVANNDGGLSIARTLIEAGIRISAYADARHNIDSQLRNMELLKKANVPILLGYAVKEAHGSKKVREVTLIRIDQDGQAIDGSETRFSCDVLCLANGLEADSSLLTQAGCKIKYDEALGEFVPSEHKPSIHSCGDVTGIHVLNSIFLQGKVSGLTAALNLISDEKVLEEPRVQHARRNLELYSKKLNETEQSYQKIVSLQPRRSVIAISGYRDQERMKRRFVCICEDVAEKDISQAIDEGFDDIETLKRYSTLSMGPCQGKMCMVPSIAVCARQTGRNLAETGRTVSRPPYQPISMGALAGAEYHPVKLTPMHHKHLELGAKMMDMGEWKRPHTYDSVEEEYRAVRERVGIIDVSTLGRLDVKGRDAPKLLDFVYTHIFSKLQIGKSRYGVICDDAGTILDDGTVTRLSDDHYFITTTTGNIEFVEQWLSWWATVLRLDAYITNVTSGLAAINVAGPRARDLLKKLTDINLLTEAFPYMNSAEALVAGVPCILLRIGFVGETGWEIHFPAEHGEYFWNKLMEAGKEFGIKPFGVEAQRILRLEKKHIIVSQDTDALSNPYESDMGWIVKLEKEDFIGKAALRLLQKKGVDRNLIGFVMQNSRVAHDGDQVYSSDGLKLVGVVTSSRFSPVNKRCVGMALVSSGTAGDGRIKIMVDGQLSDAEVTQASFYDPEGKRLRS
jgi:sarcosine oxidase subunit alpha